MSSCDSLSDLHSEEYEVLKLPSPPILCEEESSSYSDEQYDSKDSQTLDNEESRRQESWWLNELSPVSQNFLRNTLNRPYLRPGKQSARIKFAENYSEKNWETCVFGDEHTIRLGRSTVHMWAGVTSERVLDLVISSERERMTPKVYIEKIMYPLLQQGVLGKHMTFVHDIAAVHMSHRVKGWFDQNEISVINFPSESSDLNIMENIWSTLQNELELMSDMKPVDRQDVLDMIYDAWCIVMDLYTGEYLEELYSSMSKRLKLCISLEGQLIYKN